jgi:hypothetical protein
MNIDRLFEDKKKYWYLTITEECPVCGYGETYRKRQYTSKPEDSSLRFEMKITYDWCDVM